MSLWRLEVRNRKFRKIQAGLWQAKWCWNHKILNCYWISVHFLQNRSLNYCYHLFCLGVSGALRILCQDHKDIQSELRKLKVLQQNQLKNQKTSNFMFHKKHDCLSFLYWSQRCKSFRRQRCMAEIFTAGWSSCKSSLSWRNFRCCWLSQKHQI